MSQEETTQNQCEERDKEKTEDSIQKQDHPSNLETELEKWKNDYLYLRAEFDNYRKHAIKERAELQKYGAERFIRDLLEVVDNFDRAISSRPNPENLHQFFAGVEMIAKEMKLLLNRHGIIAEECLNQPFDPSRHEAVGSEVTDQVKPGYITKVLKTAYRYHDKLLRPAQVLVAIAPDQTFSE